MLEITLTGQQSILVHPCLPAAGQGKSLLADHSL